MLKKFPFHMTFQDDFPESITVDFAKEELTRYLKLIFNEESANDGEEWVVILSDKPANSLKYDGYEVIVSEDSITISSYLPRGILYGVYEFLKMLGCRFLFPKPEFEIIPKLSEINIENRAAVKNPYLEYRGLALYQVMKETADFTVNVIDWMTKNNYNFMMTSIHREDWAPGNGNAVFWDETEDVLLPQLKKRGTVIDMSEHSTDYFFPRDELFNEHPEWFALIGGERRPRQICYSNKDAVARYAQSFADYATTHHDFEFLGLWPLDGGGYCQCEQCQNPLSIFKANEVVAEAVYKVRPDITVEFLAYTPQSFSRPEGDLPVNMSVLVCDVYDKVAYEWGQKARNSGGAFFFDYLTGDNCRFRANVWLNPCYCRDMINTMVSYKYRGTVSLFLPILNWWQSCINYWYMSELYYSPLLSISELTEKFSAYLLGDTNKDTVYKILMKIFTELQDRNMWSRVPHAQPYYKARLTDRNKEMDREHYEYIRKTCDDLYAMLDSLDTENITDSQKIQIESVRDYITLQWLFFENIDQYDLENPTTSPEKYIDFIKQLESDSSRGFVPYKYANWRIMDTADVLQDFVL